jgi:hypothetical protein
MRRLYTLTLVTALFSLPGLAWSAGEERAENLKAWEWGGQVPLPAGGAKTFDFLVSPALFDKTRTGLNDLRLRDARNKEVPYDLRIRSTRDNLEPLPADVFDRGTDAKGNVTLSLDLKSKDVRHNAIDIVTSGSNFRRKVRIEGRDKDGEWSSLLPKADNAELLSFDVEGQHLNVSRFVYPESRRQFVRVIVSPDPGIENDKPVITSVTVSKYVQDPGLFVFAPAQVAEREPIQFQSEFCSAWTLSFSDCTVPVDRLTVDVADREFFRPYYVLLPTADGNSEVLSSGEWRRVEGEPSAPLEIRFREVITNHLRLVFVDSRNQPLSLPQVAWSAPARQVILPADVAGPLRVYAGNPKVQKPAYDFAAGLALKLNPPPKRIDVNALQMEKNPEYQPPPVPLTEQYPWAVYVVLSVASLILLGLMLVLGRQALARAPAQPVPT